MSSLTVKRRNTPSRLKKLRIWLPWRHREIAGRRSKVPYDPRSNRIAKWTDPSVPADFETAYAAYRIGRYDGLQAVIKGTGITAIDIDNCRDPKTGRVKPWAMKIVRRLRSYTEVSPSGTGLHIFVEGKWPGSQLVWPKASGRIEIKRHMVSVTGHRLAESPKVIKRRNVQLKRLAADLETGAALPPAQEEKSGGGYCPRIEQIIEKVKLDAACRKLWDGDLSEHPDRSQADHFLLRRIAFYAGPRPDLIKRAFLRSPLSSRPKVTQRPDYLKRTISHAMRVQDSFFPWPINNRSDAEEPLSPAYMTVRELRHQHPKLRPHVIHGLLREGETMNVIGASKTKKTFLVHALGIAVATGRAWMGFLCQRGGVLLLDNELHAETLAQRLPLIAEALKVDLDQLNGNLVVETLRGRLKDIKKFSEYFDRLKLGRFKLVIIDAFYRMLPEDCDENSNAGMADVYNTIDKYAQQLGCAFILVHHASKGSQSSKSITDVGAGAGAQSRAADTHLIVREHEEKDAVVVEFVARSWPHMPPICMRWKYPVWQMAGDLDPTKLKRKSSRTEKKDAEPKEQWTAESFTKEFIRKKPRTIQELQNAVKGRMSLAECKRQLTAAIIAKLIVKKQEGRNRPSLYSLTSRPQKRKRSP